MRRSLVGLAALLLGLSVHATSAAAQDKPGGQITPMCAQGCIPDYAVEVTPDAQPVGRASFGVYFQTFTVRNAGTRADTYELWCYGSGVLTCNVGDLGTLSLAGGQSTSVKVYYSTAGAGLGTLQLTASAEPAYDAGSFAVTVTGPGAPVLSLSPYVSTIRDASLCAVSCFDFIYQKGTPSYTSRDVARSITLVYNSATHRPTPVIQLDASYNPQTTQYPTSYKVEVTRAGALLTLQNGATAAYFEARAGQPTRLAAAIDAEANGLPTGVYGVTVTVTAIYPSATLSSTVPTQFVVLDESGSAYGAGFQLAGVQRLYLTGGAALLAEGDGSWVLYENGCGYNPCGAYRLPGGTSAVLTWNASVGAYRRIYLDSSYVEFNATGRMTKAVDRFGSTTQLAYTDTLLTSITDPAGKRSALGYGGNGKLITIWTLNLPLGWWTRATNVTTDAAGRVITISDPDGYSDSLSYQASGAGLVQSIWNRARARTDVAFDGANRLSRITAPAITTFDGTVASPLTWLQAAEVTAWQPGTAGTSEATRKAGLAPDSVGAWISDSAPLGPATVRLAVDPRGAPLTVVDPYGATTRFTRDTASRVTKLVQPNGHTVTYTYTGLLLTGMMDSTLNRNESYAYTARNDLAVISGNTVRRDFLYYSGTDGGPAGALKKVYAGNTGYYPNMVNARLLAWHKPDAFGRDTVVTDSLGHATRFSYDLTWGNTSAVTQPDGSRFRVTYDGRGQVDSSWTPLQGKTSFTYGSLNQVLTQRTAYNYLTQYQYDPATLALVRLVDPKAQVYKWQYNALGQLTVQHDVADTTKADTLRYDVHGQVRQRVTRRGDVIALDYDHIGRLVRREFPGEAPDSFAYDPNGKWVAARNAWARDSIGFRSTGQDSSVVQVVHGRAFTVYFSYDSYRRPTILSVSGVLGSQSYSQNTFFRYGSSGMLDTLIFGLNKSVVTARNGDGLPTSIKHGSWFLSQLFNSDHELTKQTYPGALSAFTQTLTRDSLDRVTSLTPPGSSPTVRKFTYDSVGRLLNACDKPGSASCLNEFGATANAYSYDPAGNRTDGSAVVGSGNRVATFRGWTLTYDAAGNIATADTAPYTSATIRRYTWDALGRLTAVKIGPDTVARFRYDALGRRRLKVTGTTTRDSLWFVYNAGAQVLVDFTGNGAADTVRAEYGYGPGSDQVWTVRQPGTGLDGVLLLDPLIGSVRGVAAWTGATLQKDYRKPLGQATPWGKTPGDTGAVLRYRWAGREYDQETGLYYMRARYYDSRLGRFLSEDPIGVAGGLNLYAYGWNDPVNIIDPSGLGPDKPCTGKWNWIDGNGDGQPEWVCVVGGGSLPEIGSDGRGPVTVWPNGGSAFGIPGLPSPALGGGEPGGVSKVGDMLPKANSANSKKACDRAVLDAALSLTVGLLPVAGAVYLRSSGFVAGMVSITARSGHLASSVPLYDAVLVPSLRSGFAGAAGLAAEFGSAQYRGSFSIWDAMSAAVSMTPVGAVAVAGINVMGAINACSGS